MQALDASWKKKHEDALAELSGQYEPQLQSLNGDLKRILIDSEAERVAHEIAIPGAAAVLIPHLRNRLGIDMRDGQRVTVVIGPDGKPSALTVEELRKSLWATRRSRNHCGNEGLR